MDAPAPGFPSFAPRDTNDGARLSDFARMVKAMRLDEPDTDPVQLMLAERDLARRKARSEAQVNKGKGEANFGRQQQSQTVRANFGAADVFERKGEAEANGPRQVRVFSPVQEADEKEADRKTGDDARSTKGGDGTGGGLSKKLGRLFNRKK